MKTAVIYYSKHHGCTKKLLDAVAKEGDVDLIDAVSTDSADLSGYDLIGFASGIYFSKFHKSVIQFAQNNLPEGKMVFFICTYGNKNDKYADDIKAVAVSKNSVELGSYGCKGFDTFGPLKLVGGINKGHPDDEDIAGAVKFFRELK